MIPTVISRFESQADRTPEAAAATFQGVTLSYAQLDARANGLAALLRERGVGPDVVVAVCIPRSIEMAVAVLGVLKAGGAYVPLDPAYPRERIAAMLDDARVQHVVAHSVTAELVAGRNMILMDKEPPPPRRERLPVIAGLSHLAYVIFTSGSTGRPKGVAMIHHPLANLVEWQLGDSDVGVGERTLQFSPLAFDVSFQELFGTWCAGGELMLVDDALRVDTVRLLRFMKDERIARVFMPFIAMQSLAEIAPSPDLTPSSLREMITAGEQLQVTPQLVRFFEAIPGVTLANHYGPSETHVVTAVTLKGAPSSWPKLPSIGHALPNVTTPILDDKQKPVPAGEVGELYLGGVHLARGYLHRPELTAERFVMVDGVRLYKTGDLAKTRPDGDIDFLGRADGQVKIRGHRVELGEVEIAVTEHPKVRQAAATVRDGRLVAYMVGDDDGSLANQVREQLTKKLPGYMVPTSFVVLAELPKTPSGKIDRKSLPEPPRVRPDLATPWAAPEGPVEQQIATGWASILKIDNVGRDDNFFDLGGNSLLAVRAIAELRETQSSDVSVVRLYEKPTVRGLASAIASERAVVPAREPLRGATATHAKPEAGRGAERMPIAIVGMAARYPGAPDLKSFWKNLVDGVESIGRFSQDELPAAHRGVPDYVAARGVLDGIESFDAPFFGVTPGEASVLDPQQRLLLELAWEALEHAGHTPGRIDGSVGVFAGTHVNTYFQNNLFKRPDVDARIGAFNVMVANEKDYVATRIAHRLSLTGPAISVHTACSTSLVAISQAIDSLHLGHCDVALAGGAAVTVPQKTGHLFADGGIMSRDGSTRSFDAQGSGTVFSDGGGMVVLKRLADAERDGDTVYALLAGAALNNDGGDKASFMAPSSRGQAAVIAMALDNAGVSARDIDYVEAHGTATPIGDPIEVDGLTQAFRRHTQDVGYCGLGSVKTNVGHTVAAAGVAGVIKTALALHHELIPASLHYDKPNPAIDFAKSPFTVVAEAKAWPRSARVRRAGVSSFGVGGTNAHVIMQEASQAALLPTTTRSYVLPISARNADTLGKQTDRIVTALADENRVADIAATLALGRRAFSERRAVVASTRDDAIAALKSGEARRVITRTLPPKAAHVVFMFPGQGSQTVGMGKRLYERYSVFRAVVDDCAERLKPHLGKDLRELIWPAASVPAEQAAAVLRDTAIAQSALFAIEYATAKLWMDFGLTPTAMIGHSVGEFVAACLSGVFSLDDGLLLVATRGRLMAAMPPGGMMSVRMAEADLAKELPAGVSIATVNAPMLSVVAGPTEAITAFGEQLAAKGVAAKALHTSHAFHSSMMDAALPPFRETVKSIRLSPPTIPFASTVNGAWVDTKTATDVEYWATHLRKTVRFVDAMATISGDDARVLLECGPRNALSQLARQQPGEKGRSRVVASLAEGLLEDDEDGAFQHALAQMWSWGAPIDWTRVYADDQVRRVALPTYPFDRKRHWIDTVVQAPSQATVHTSAEAAVPPIAVAAPPPAQTEESSLPMSNSNATLDALKVAFEDVSGLDLASADPGASFFELGVDSLLLTQLALKVQTSFGVKVTFRQLTESFGTLGALASHLEANGAGVKAAAPTAQAAAAQAVAAPVMMQQPTMFHQPTMFQPMPMMGAPIGGGDPVRQLIDAQLRVMQQQLAILAGQGMQMAAPMPMPTAEVRAPITDHRLPIADGRSPMAESREPSAAPKAASEDDEVKATQKYDVKKAFGAIARITTTKDGGLTPKQQARLDALTRRYTQKTAKSKAYTTLHRPHLADPRVVTGFRPLIKELVYQIVVDRSKGCRLWDIDGNEYIDALNGFGSNFFGNSPDFITKAIREQLDRGYELGPQHVLAGEVAKMFCDIVGADRAGWCNTGSEAVMGALRIARTVTGRKTVAIFSGSYHGIFDEVLVRGSKSLRSLPAAPGIMPEYVGNVLVLDYGTDESLKIIRERAHELAAVMIEPIQSRRPDFAPREFVQALREITEKSGSALIFDEVITGLRTGHGGAQEYYGVKADIATYGKVIGGGMPVGLIAGKRAWLDALDGGFWQFGDDSTPPVGVTYFAGTFVRHPFALVAAKAVCEYLKTNGPSVQQGVTAKAERFQNELNRFFGEVDAPIKVKRFSSLWKMMMTSDQPYGDLLFVTMRDKGLHILDGFPCFMTLAHSDADVDRMIAIVKEATREMIAGDLLPGKAEAEPVALDANQPPIPGARLGKDREGNPAWFVPNPNEPGKFMQVNA